MLSTVSNVGWTMLSTASNIGWCYIMHS